MNEVPKNTPRIFSPSRWLRGVITQWMASAPRRKGNPRCFRAAIVKVDRLGDFVLALSAIRLTLAHFGEDRCLLIVSPQVAPIAAGEFPRTPCLVLPAFVGHKCLLWKGVRSRSLLAHFSCEEAVCFRHVRWDYDELMLLWLGARRFHLLDDMSAHDYYATRNTFLFQTEGRRPFLPSSMSVSSDALLCRDLWMHRQLLAETIERAVTVEEILPSFVRLPEHSANCRNIAVAPFSSAAIKDFPEKLLCEALHEVRMHTKAPVELHGDASQRERLLRLMERLRLAGIENVECAALVGAQEFIQALAGARLVLTVDSAAAHIATALDRPCVILMGGGHYGQFGPWRRSARQVWLTHQMECFGCSWNCIHSEPYCLTHIARDSLRAAVAQALQQEAPK